MSQNGPKNALIHVIFVQISKQTESKNSVASDLQSEAKVNGLHSNPFQHCGKNVLNLEHRMGQRRVSWQSQLTVAMCEAHCYPAY